MNVVKVHDKEFRGAHFKFCEISDEPHANASAFTFEDEQEVRDRHWHIKEGDVVLDVGAAFGSYALPAIALGAEVVAFSPADFDTALLRMNLAKNGGAFQLRCVIVGWGLHGADGWFDSVSSKIVDGVSFPAAKERGLLQVRRLDDWVDSLLGVTLGKRVDWIKMDIEGAEVAALHGAEQTIRRFAPKLLIENHLFHDGGTEAAVRDFVLGLGMNYHCETHPHHGVSHSFFEVRT